MPTEQPRHPTILHIESRLDLFAKGQVALSTPKEAHEYAQRLTLQVDIAYEDKIINLLEATQYKYKIRDAFIEYKKVLTEV